MLTTSFNYLPIPSAAAVLLRLRRAPSDDFARASDVLLLASVLDPDQGGIRLAINFGLTLKDMYDEMDEGPLESLQQEMVEEMLRDQRLDAKSAAARHKELGARLPWYSCDLMARDDVGPCLSGDGALLGCSR